jgi:opacity protein-like surface antigen
MRNTNILIVLSLICAFQGGSAAAADWSGLYIGVNQATETLSGDWTTTETRDSLGFEKEPSSDTEATLESEESGNGVRIGLNGNPGNWVFGLEAVKESIRHEDSIDDRIPGLGVPSSKSPSHVEFRAENDDVNLRLRGGYLVLPQLLFYVTAGPAKLDVEVTSTCSDGDNVCADSKSFNNEKTLNGKAVGLGLEYQLFGFLLRAEYVEADYDDFSFTAIPDQLGSSDGADATMAVKTELTQLGLSYQF